MPSRTPKEGTSTLDLLLFCVVPAPAQSDRVPEKSNDLQRAVNAVRTAHLANIDSVAFEAKLDRANQETLRFANGLNESIEEMQVGLAYIDALGIYDCAEKIHKYLGLPNICLRNSIQLSKIVDKYELPTKLVHGTDNRRVKTDALPKMWKLASESLDTANQLLANYKELPEQISTHWPRRKRIESL